MVQPYQIFDLDGIRVGVIGMANISTITSIYEGGNSLGILDAHFAHGGQFVTGEFFTLADVALGLSTHRWLLSPIDRPHLDAVHGYYQRLSVRPAFRAHVDASVP